MLVSTILLFAALGPFGTFLKQTYFERLLFWGGCISLISFAFAVVMRIDGKIAPQRRFWVLDGFLVLAFTLVSGLIMQVAWWLFVEDAVSHSLPFGTVVVSLVPVYLAALAAYRASKAKGAIDVDAKMEMPAEAPRILQRLPEEKRGELIRLTVDDHYVDVWTTQGCHRVLMRLTDAITETEGTRGVCVHRSHWVALTAIKTLHKDKGRVSLLLADDSTVPVSRKHQRGVERVVEAGTV
jgi:hypothetical protein